MTWPLNLGVSHLSTMGGLTFAHDNGIFMAVWDGTSPNSNGTNNLIFSPFSLGSGNMTITKTGGGVFDLLSFDMVISWYNSNPNEVVFVNGSPLNLTQTLTNFAVNLIGVSSVTISNIGVNGSYWSADNFNVNVGVSDVPVPAALPLLAAGLAGLGYAGRRRRKTAH